ncbi:MAG: hypothetical protein HYU54_00720, partial [Actinobacteria bacterium]|nr:hypothetical protein [Actinomycetota bacterium]
TRLDARYAKLERVAGRVALRLLGALRAERAASDALDAAQQRLDDRVRAAYELGPGGALEAFLSATSLADLLSIQEFTSRTIAQDATAVEELREAEARLVERRAAAERAQAALAPRELELGILLSRMRAEVSAAERLAARAGLEVTAIEEHRRTLEDAAARRVGRNLLATGATGAEQEELLALLGPSRGRGCEIPEGLVDTGKRFSGLASWYGWEFAGQSTANGAIFDPRLFTAANRWLPFGTFLRVHYRGECAIVLVNDRGPYGDYARVIDLSMAAAHYLGVGVSPVTADILVPA